MIRASPAATARPPRRRGERGPAPRAVSPLRRFLLLYLPVACAILAAGFFAAFVSTARLLWRWRHDWSHDATWGAGIAVALFLVAALCLRLAIFQPWRRRLEVEGAGRRRGPRA